VQEQPIEDDDNSEQSNKKKKKKLKKHVLKLIKSANLETLTIRDIKKQLEYDGSIEGLDIKLFIKEVIKVIC
jgi:hypothetical protein